MCKNESKGKKIRVPRLMKPTKGKIYSESRED